MSFLIRLLQSNHGYGNVLSRRNAWIEDLKNNQGNYSEKYKIALYFGTPLQGRSTDELLQRHGIGLVAEIGCDAPKIVTADFTEFKDLLPGMKQPRYSEQVENWAQTIHLPTASQPPHRPNA